MTRMPGTQIVVGVDGSAAAETAVRWAVREARLRHAAVRLVCAFHTDTRLRAPYTPLALAHEDEPRAPLRSHWTAPRASSVLLFPRVGW